ncbi:MAG: hypothetical protein KGJ07_06150 [Patescibacteria group bacterium]|nr:hypothetical protein [Patescibacteria group bacterium]MDE2588231.1 hypothetical protein [Patescibacteria group bacterium]
MRIPYFSKKPTHYLHLKEKWAHTHYKLQERLWENHKEALETFLRKPKRWMLGTLAGAMLLTAPMASASAPATTHQTAGGTFQDFDKKTFFMSDVYNILPHEVQPLTPNEESRITDMISNTYGIPVTAEISGIRLNRNYGYIGQEQHLTRFPGDTIDTHFDSQEEAVLYASKGMAPGKGAWGYFAPSQQEMTPEDDLREKWYIAVPTFLTPGYAEHVREYSTFFKYRKMLVVNPNNGKAIVADIADSGPSEWTGKHLGGSPEVMHYLERVDGAQKGPVLYFFIDDNVAKNVPLGPIAL